MKIEILIKSIQEFLDTSQEVKKTLEEEYQKFQNVGDLIKNEKFSVLNAEKI